LQPEFAEQYCWTAPDGAREVLLEIKAEARLPETRKPADGFCEAAESLV
jgi:hypothetical protein